MCPFSSPIDIRQQRLAQDRGLDSASQGCLQRPFARRRRLLIQHIANSCIPMGQLTSSRDVPLTAALAGAALAAALGVASTWALMRHRADCPDARPQPTSPSCCAKSPAPRRRLFASPSRADSQGAPAAHPSCSHGAPATQPCSHGTPSRRADPFAAAPRAGYLSWDEYFMAVAFLSAQRSKDPNKQVGACIVNEAQIIVGIGYNGFPRGCADTALPWAKKSRTGNVLETKYPYVVHAEANALLNKNAAQVTGARIYVTMFPCNECAKLLIQAGIKEVVYHEAKAETSSHLPDTCSAALQDQVEDYAPGTGPVAMAAAEAGYIASRRLLTLAGVKLRQHTLQKGLAVRDRPLAPA